MNTFSITQNIGEIVAVLPEAGRIFRQYGIDFCCGGNRPLSKAINEQSLNGEEILNRLNSAFIEAQAAKTAEMDFRSVTLTRLTDYIVDTHHAYLIKELPELGELTTRILRVHGGRHEELLKIHKLFHLLKADLEQHLFKEEESLFPLIREYEANPSEELKTMFAVIIKETENEHESAGDILKELRKISGQYSVPADGCSSYVLAYQKLQEIEADLFQHIHLENNILFRRL